MSGAPIDTDETVHAAARTRLAVIGEEVIQTKAAIAHLKGELEALQAEAAQLVRIHDLDGLLMVDPVSNDKVVLTIRQDRYLKDVDLDQLRDRLGQSAVDAVLGQPKVSAAKWNKACELGLIPDDVAAAVARWELKQAYVSFVAPDDRGDRDYDVA